LIFKQLAKCIQALLHTNTPHPKGMLPTEQKTRLRKIIELVFITWLTAICVLLSSLILTDGLSKANEQYNLNATVHTLSVVSDINEFSRLVLHVLLYPLYITNMVVIWLMVYLYLNCWSVLHIGFLFWALFLTYCATQQNDSVVKSEIDV
jgi:hypothetical protein